MCNDILSHYMGHLRRLGKDPCPRDMLSHGHSLPLRPLWCHLGGASCSKGLPRTGPAPAFDFWTILNEKAGVTHTGTENQVLGFKVNVSRGNCSSGVCHLGSIPVLSFVLGHLASQVGHSP